METLTYKEIQAQELIKRHRKLHKVVMEYYGGFNSVIAGEMNIIELEFIALMEQTIYQYQGIYRY